MVYTQIDSKVGFLPRQLGSKFSVFTRALLFSNGRSLQTQKLAPLPCQKPTFESICVYLKNWPNLKRLDLESTWVSDDDFVQVKHLCQLQDLNLCECIHITQKVFHDVVQHLPGLTSLNLSRFIVRKDDWSPNAPIVRSDDCADISLLRKLDMPFKQEHRTNDWVSDETFASISHLSQLQRLELRCVFDTFKIFSVSGCWYFDDSSFEYLTGLKGLRELDVSHCEITWDSMELLHHFPQLEKIHLSSCHGIAKQGLKILEVLQNCESGISAMWCCYEITIVRF